MRAELLDQAVVAGAVAECNEVLAEQGDRASWVVVHLLDRGERHPVATHQLAHRGAGPNLGEALVLFFRQHLITSRLGLRVRTFGRQYSVLPGDTLGGRGPCIYLAEQGLLSS